jgi:hypothetical protein
MPKSLDPIAGIGDDANVNRHEGIVFGQGCWIKGHAGGKMGGNRGKDCAFCRFSRLFVAACGLSCFGGLTVLSIRAGLSVPVWVWTGLAASAVFSSWVLILLIKASHLAKTDAKTGA